MRLDNIFIRAKLNGKWGSYSIEELIDEGEMVEVLTWILSKFFQHGNGFPKDPNVGITKEDVSGMIQALENFGATIFRVKDD